METTNLVFLSSCRASFAITLKNGNNKTGQSSYPGGASYELQNNNHAMGKLPWRSFHACNTKPCFPCYVLLFKEK